MFSVNPFSCSISFLQQSVLRSRSSIEENHSKLLSKLAKQAAGGCVQGTFAPLWHVLRTSAEKLANLHMQMVQKVSELVKEVSRYADELHKKHKTVCRFPFHKRFIL